MNQPGRGASRVRTPVDWGTPHRPSSPRIPRAERGTNWWRAVLSPAGSGPTMIEPAVEGRAERSLAVSSWPRSTRHLCASVRAPHLCDCADPAHASTIDDGWQGLPESNSPPPFSVVEMCLVMEYGRARQAFRTMCLRCTVINVRWHLLQNPGPDNWSLRVYLVAVCRSKLPRRVSRRITS